MGLEGEDSGAENSNDDSAGNSEEAPCDCAAGNGGDGDSSDGRRKLDGETSDDNAGGEEEEEDGATWYIQATSKSVIKIFDSPLVPEQFHGLAPPMKDTYFWTGHGYTPIKFCDED